MPGEKIAEKLTSYLRKKQESKSSNTYEPLSDAHAGILTFFWKQRQTGRRGGGGVVDEHYQTSVEGIFAAGNVLQVHDLVDFVSLEAESLADGMVRYIRSGHLPTVPWR